MKNCSTIQKLHDSLNKVEIYFEVISFCNIFSDKCYILIIAVFMSFKEVFLLYHHYTKTFYHAFILIIYKELHLLSKCHRLEYKNLTNKLTQKEIIPI